MSQQKESVFIQQDLESPECFGVIGHLSPASWEERLDLRDAGLRCLKQTAELLKGEEVEGGTHVAPGRDGLTPPSATVISLGGNGFITEVVSSWYRSTPLQPRLCLLQLGAYA